MLGVIILVIIALFVFVGKYVNMGSERARKINHAAAGFPYREHPCNRDNKQ